MFLPEKMQDPFLTIIVLEYIGKLQIEHPLVHPDEKGVLNLSREETIQLEK